MRFYKFIPGNKICLEVPLPDFEVISFLPGETVWLSSEQEDYFLQHALVKQLIRQGQLIAFHPMKPYGASVLSSYTFEDAKQIASGLFDIEIAIEMLGSERDNAPQEIKDLLQRQIEKLKSLPDKKVHPLGVGPKPPKKQYSSNKKRKRKPKDIHESFENWLEIMIKSGKISA